MRSLVERLAAFPLPEEAVAFRDQEGLLEFLYSLDHVEVTRIGFSRNGQEMYGVRFGTGPRNATVIAGCHADEPIGPMTAQILPRLVRAFFPEFLETYTFRVVPQMNPDGAVNNQPWFRHPLDIEAYLEHVIRESPGDDIEFGFGGGPGQRPECATALKYLAPAMPAAFHASLHGMAWSEGAWCLICKEWADRAGAFMGAFTQFCEVLPFPLHDIERHGEKGFTRIREGFCTTPTGDAMRAHFRRLNDQATASRFRSSSMDWVLERGGDPLCLVSEIPLFLMGVRSHSLDAPQSVRLSQALQELRASGRDKTPESIQKWAEDFGLTPTPIELQIRLQVAMLLLGLQQAQEGGTRVSD